MAVSTKRDAYDPYMIIRARDIIKLMARGVPIEQVSIAAVCPVLLFIRKILSTLSFVVGAENDERRDVLRDHQDPLARAQPGALREAAGTLDRTERDHFKGEKPHEFKLFHLLRSL